MAEVVKKKTRRIFSCSNCRQRKRKCDRKEPCGECTRQGLYESCQFEDVKPFKGSSVPSSANPGTISSETFGELHPSTEDEHSKNRTKNPPKDWDFNFFEAMNKLKKGVVEASLLGYYTMVGADPFTDIIKQLLAKQLHKIWGNLISKDGMVPKEKLERLEQKAVVQFGSAYICKLSANSTEDQYNAARRAINAGNVHTGIQFKPEGSWTRLLLREQFLEMLPPHSVLIALVRVFFNFQKKWFLILNEEDFFDELNNVVGPSVDGQCVIKRFESHTDAAIAASVLLAVRLAYLIVVHSKNECSEEIRASILKNAVPLDAVDVARELMKEMTNSFGASLHCLRAYMLQLTHEIFCSEYEHGGDSNQSLEILHKIISQATSLHLNIDHTKLAKWRGSYEASEKVQDEARTLWHSILRLDLFCSVVFEEELCIQPNSYIVKTPSKNIHETSRCVEYFLATEDAFRSLQELVVSMTPYASRLSYNELANRIHNLENQIANSLGKTEDYLLPLEDQSSPLKCQKFMLLLCCKCWLLAIYNSLALFFEKESENELSFEYSKRGLSIALKDFSFLETGLMDHIEDYFGSGTFMLVVPFIILAIKAQLSVSGFGVRCAISSKLSEYSQLNMEGIRSQHLYNTIGHALTSLVDSTLELLEPLAEAIQLVWGLSRSTWLGKMLVFEKEAFAADGIEKEGVALNYSAEQLKEFNEILNDAILERKLYKKMYGSPGVLKDTSIEGKENRMLAAFQLERKWQLVNMIRSRNHNSTFLSHAGLRSEDSRYASLIPVSSFPYNMENIQGFHPQLVMDYFYTGEF